MTIAGERGRPNQPSANAPVLAATEADLAAPDGILKLLNRMLVEVVLPQCRTDGTANLKYVVDAVTKLSKEIREHCELANFGKRAQKISELATRVLEARSGCTADEIRALINEVAEVSEGDDTD